MQINSKLNSKPYDYLYVMFEISTQVIYIAMEKQPGQAVSEIFISDFF